MRPDFVRTIQDLNPPSTVSQRLAAGSTCEAVMAALAAVIARCSGESEVVVGTRVVDLSGDPTFEEIAKDSGFTIERIRELFSLVEDPVSLETPVGDGESMVADMIEDLKAESPDGAHADHARSQELAGAIERLNPRMKHVVLRRFGLDGKPPQTLEEVGTDLGITRERVRQLETRALRDLRALAPGLQLYLQT